MQVPFTKMHGLGNDFVVLDGRAQNLPLIDMALTTALADRHTGIGFDQLIVLSPSDKADFTMRFYNADGSESGACGNGSRAIGLLHGKAAAIETTAGILHTSPKDSGIAVDMGAPKFGWDAIPLAYAMDTLAMPVGWEDLNNPVAVNIGNPHAVFFVDDHQAVDLARLGPLIEHDPLFPERVNVNVARVQDRQHIALRVWERGAGETRACGTGACATAVAAMRRGLVDRSAEISLPGGLLQIDWREDNGITMTGPAAISFHGSFDTQDYGLPA